MPNEKRTRQKACLSSGDERTPPPKHEASGAILESIHEKLNKLDVLAGTDKWKITDDRKYRR